uniref:C-type lectin domain-containing protein n=1 Tax=Poecilia reticulata TaxID=8081 RepID=A0A3P9N7I0_POERE
AKFFQIKCLNLFIFVSACILTFYFINYVSALPVFCPAGWRRFGCSCYLLSSSMSSWEGSRAQCLLTGADLVTISSQEEMLGAQLKVWIGLKEEQNQLNPPGFLCADLSDPGFLCSSGPNVAVQRVN